VVRASIAFCNRKESAKRSRSPSPSPPAFRPRALLGADKHMYGTWLRWSSVCSPGIVFGLGIALFPLPHDHSQEFTQRHERLWNIPLFRGYHGSSRGNDIVLARHRSRPHLASQSAGLQQTCAIRKSNGNPVPAPRCRPRRRWTRLVQTVSLGLAPSGGHNWHTSLGKLRECFFRAPSCRRHRHQHSRHTAFLPFSPRGQKNL